MSRAENRHYEKLWRNKKHPAAKCRKARCIICHFEKVHKIIKPKYKSKKEDYDTDN